MSGRLKSKVALVTGASRGIGEGIALALAQEGADVAVVGRASQEKLQKVALSIENCGCRSLPILADVSKAEEVKNMVDETLKEFEKIDILVNNAGIIRMSPLVEMAEAEWDEVLNVNLKSVFLCSKAVVPHMIKRKGGKIINVSSTGGKTGWPLITHYCASKFGIIGFTQSLAKEVGVHNITVNALCPGEVKTEMWTDFLCQEWSKGAEIAPEKYYDHFVETYSPLGRGMAAEEVGEAVVFFCTSDSITGQALNVCAGTEMH
jgi:meso-butanediol dehydrogenase/(S,S)-butanediol dehydrogenase/diacetyl reductase